MEYRRAAGELLTVLLRVEVRAESEVKKFRDRAEPEPLRMRGCVSVTRTTLLSITSAEPGPPQGFPFC